MNEQEPMGGSALLWARIVDEAGRPIGPADLAGIELSVLELPVFKIDPGRRVDGEGFNFRHQVDLRAAGPIRPEAEFQICYRLTTLAGRETTLRFHLRAVAAAPEGAPRAGPQERPAAPGAARTPVETMR